MGIGEFTPATLGISLVDIWELWLPWTATCILSCWCHVCSKIMMVFTELVTKFQATPWPQGDPRGVHLVSSSFPRQVGPVRRNLSPVVWSVASLFLGHWGFWRSLGSRRSTEFAAIVERWKVDPAWLWHSQGSPWLWNDGPDRNRWSTELKNGDFP